MSNRIRRIELSNRTLAPAEAEVWVTVHLDEVTPTTEVRGRLMGPTCLYASTVEVAYPLRPLAKSQKPKASDGPSLTMRVVIPEPSLWDPECPFLYSGPVELWQGGERLAQITIRHGLHCQTLGPRGLRWNGRPLTLRGRPVETCTEEEMLALRAAGYNLLTVHVSENTAPQWERADRIGFLLLGRVRSLEETVVAELAAHSACFGMLFNVDVWLHADRGKREQFITRTHTFVGLEAHAPPTEQLSTDVDFVVCDAEEGTTMAGVGLPLLLRGKSEANHPPVLGWIE
jgi:hypothetical protein